MSNIPKHFCFGDENGGNMLNIFGCFDYKIQQGN